MYKRLKHRYGNTEFESMIDYDGYRFSSMFHEEFDIEKIDEHFLALRTMEIREDDVFIMTYPKSGTHLIREVVYMLQTGKLQYIPLDLLDFSLSYRQVEEMNNVPSPRVLHSHAPLRMLPRQVLEGRGKVIALVRNPRDVCVSYWHFQTMGSLIDCTFEQFLHLFMEGWLPGKTWHHWRDEMIAFRKSSNLPILVLKYEDCTKDLEAVVKKTATFLGHNYSDEFYKDIVRACNIDKMRKGKTDGAQPDDVKTHMPGTGYDVFYRKGGSGDWKNTFTVHQDEQFSKWMRVCVTDDNTEFPSYVE